ncbi:MAG: hypothetical protein AVDCRST_MAG27-1749 [uncultured Craurococcus sp.]|uniref:Uncharacterized protein n=1 Tax=uncultured Craurococcus sp. TaxID=1135998 RepID=A0A6J4IB56_9PROT|nr:MAG: hypothetical protein AVDCRST_MAG27-1749 [uncultured Craurococcus sp.]
MMRRLFLIGLVGVALPAAAQQLPPAPATPAERQRQLDAWWARQREKEATDRAINGPREARRNLTRDQFEFWNRQSDRRRGIPLPPF